MLQKIVLMSIIINLLLQILVMQAMIQFMPNAKQRNFNGMMNERLYLHGGDEHEIQNHLIIKKNLSKVFV